MEQLRRENMMRIVHEKIKNDSVMYWNEREERIAGCT